MMEEGHQLPALEVQELVGRRGIFGVIYSCLTTVLLSAQEWPEAGHTGAHRMELLYQMYYTKATLWRQRNFTLHGRSTSVRLGVGFRNPLCPLKQSPWFKQNLHNSTQQASSAVNGLPEITECHSPDDHRGDHWEKRKDHPSYNTETLWVLPKPIPLGYINHR